MGLSWPSAYSWLWDKAQQYWPKADESGLRTAEQSFMTALPGVESAFSDLVSGHQDLVKALGESDSASAAQTKLTDIQSRGETLNQIIVAEFSMMNAAPQNIDTAKKGLIDKAKAADSDVKSSLMGFLGTQAPSVTQSIQKKVAAQFDSDAKPVHDTYTQSNQKLLQLPDGVEDDAGGPVKTSVDYETATDKNSNPTVSRSNLDQGSVKNNAPGVTSNSNLDQASVKNNAPDTQNANYDQGQQASSGSASGGQGAPTSGGQGSGGQGAGGGSSAPASGASTGLQSGAALADHAASAAPTQSSGAGAGGGGGIGAPPSISGIGGGPAGGAGSTPRIGGIGGGPGGEGPRTGVQGAGVTEKPAGSSSSSGSGSQQGSGLSRGGAAGAGSAGGATQAQSAQQAALRDAVRTGDTAAGAGRAADRVAGHSDVLGTGHRTDLSPTALQAAHGQTAMLGSALGGLEGSLAASHPASSAGELAHWVVNGGTVAGAGRAGFLADGITWGRVEQPPFEHVGLSGLALLFEDMRVAPNEAAGVFRPVAARVTTTGWLGEVDPAMRLPEGTRILDRSKAPAGTDQITDPGLLAVGLAKWLLEAGLDGDKSWRLTAVCFLEEPDSEYVHSLATMPSPVESYWPGRPGYEANMPQAAVADARTLSDEELQVKQSDPLQHAQDVARLDPDGLYDPTGLPPKEAEWYRKSAERTGKPQLTNARWKQELDQYRKEERGGDGGLNW